MVSSSDPAAVLATATLARGRNAVVEPQRALATAVEGTLQPAATTGGSELELNLCRTASELARSLSQGTALDLAAGPLPLPLLRARQEFLSSLHTTLFSVSLVVQARRVSSAVELVEPRLRAGLAPPTDPAALDAFVERFGDSYVNALQIGGEVQGVYTFYAQTRAQAQQVEQAFGGAAGLGGLRLGPEFSRRTAEVARSAGVNVGLKVMVRGLRDLPDLSTPERLLEFAAGFGEHSLDDPQPLELAIRGYETVPGLREAFAPVAANRELFCGDVFGGGLLRRELQLREILNQCRWLEGTYALYGVTADPGLAAQQRRIEADLGTLLDLQRQYLRSPSTRLEVPDLPSLRTGSPRLNVTLVEPPDAGGRSMGGGGGEPFDFTDGAGAVPSRRRLVRVGLRAMGRIDQIRLTYEREPDAFTVAPRRQEVHGGTGGSDRGALELAPGESIAEIRAETGTRVDNLTLTTTAGRSLGGGGTAGNRPMHWRRADNEVLLGFRGRAGAELDGLQPIVARFGPLAWEPLDAAEAP